MATTKSSRLLDVELNRISSARQNGANVRAGVDVHAVTADELDTNDVILFDIDLPSNAIMDSIYVRNDDLDSNGSPTLAFDIGLAASSTFTSVTSSVRTVHSADDVLDADLFVDGSTVGRAATTAWTLQDCDAATFGPDDAGKALWELLGYDHDPGARLRVAVTVAAGAGTAAAGDLALKVVWFED